MGSEPQKTLIINFWGFRTPLHSHGIGVTIILNKHRTVLIIFSLILRTIISAQMLYYWRGRNHSLKVLWIAKSLILLTRWLKNNRLMIDASQKRTAILYTCWL